MRLTKLLGPNIPEKVFFRCVFNIKFKENGFPDEQKGKSREKKNMQNVRPRSAAFWRGENKKYTCIQIYIYTLMFAKKLSTIYMQ